VQAWKPLLIVIPAGLLLGSIGGHYAQPVMTEHPDSSLDALFQSRAERNGADAAAPQPQDASYYSGEYSYPPYLDDRMLGDGREITGWQGPSFADWPEYTPAPMPSVAQLQAQLAARDTALGQRAWGGYGETDEDVSAAEAASAAAADAAANAADIAQPHLSDQADSSTGPKVVVFSQATLPAGANGEPRTPDGGLPAIW
jgi:hypothetical protein